jgi:hypothetical protein
LGRVPPSKAAASEYHRLAVTNGNWLIQVTCAIKSELLLFYRVNPLNHRTATWVTVVWRSLD